MTAHHVQEPKVGAVASLRERASSGHGRVGQSEQHRRYPERRERTDYPDQPLLDHPAEQHLFEKPWRTNNGDRQVLTVTSNIRGRIFGYIAITFHAFQPNSWEVAPSASFWTNRGHRCLPFTPPPGVHKNATVRHKHLVACSE